MKLIRLSLFQKCLLNTVEIKYNIMADITKCRGTDCPLKESCYRFLAMEGLRQSYFIYVPFKDGKCKYYWNIK